MARGPPRPSASEKKRGEKGGRASWVLVNGPITEPIGEGCQYRGAVALGADGFNRPRKPILLLRSDRLSTVPVTRPGRFTRVRGMRVHANQAHLVNQ